MLLKLGFTPRVLLIDIEGTTTSISYVKDVLFPYADNCLISYLERNWNTEQLRDDVKLLREEAAEALEKGLKEIPQIMETGSDEEIKEAVIENVRWQMSIDRKSSGLKQLQGHIWQEGYSSKQLVGHVYDDVPPAFELWKNKHAIDLYIYSSGSVEAQKLLFSSTKHGNLLKYISGHFDTTIGLKVESKSYKKILSELNVKAKEVIFLTDVLKEAQAATEAGIKSVIVLRSGNASIDEESLLSFDTVDNFSKIIFK